VVNTSAQHTLATVQTHFVDMSDFGTPTMCSVMCSW